MYGVAVRGKCSPDAEHGILTKLAVTVRMGKETCRMCVTIEPAQLREICQQTANAVTRQTAGIVLELGSGPPRGADVCTVYTTFERGVTFGAAVDGLAEQNFERATADIEVDAELKNLLYRVYHSSEAMMDIAAVVESIQLHRILGIAEAGIELDADIGGGAVTKKFLTAEHGIDLLTEVTETFTQYMKPEMVTVALDTSASAILRRFRKVSEVDPLSLASIDTMTLDELDYVVLSG